MWEIYNDYYRTAVGFSPYVFMPFALAEYIEQDIQRMFPEQYEIISSPSQPTQFQKMQFMLATTSAEKVAKRYNWLNIYSLNEHPHSIDYFRRLKKNVNRDEIKGIRKRLSDNKRQFDKFILLVKNKEILRKCELLHEYACIRTDRVDAWNHALFYLLPLYRRIAAQFHLSVYQAINLTHDEMRKAFQRGIVPARDEMEKRSKKKCVLDYHGGKLHFVYEKEKIKDIKRLVEESVPTLQVIKGIVANKGRVQGRVMILTKRGDIAKLQERMILVAVATVPAYTPYLKKCAAIVTDEGGITSHAAIVSRELKIPCIIGTKIATKILKDGDLVEVDADSGIVTILSAARRSAPGASQTYRRTFSRDFSLANIEIWYRAESVNRKGWTAKKQPYQPYIIYEKMKGFVDVYYSEEGLRWTKRELIACSRKKGFFRKLETVLMRKLAPIERAYTRQTALGYARLVVFLKHFEEAYPWLEAMWFLTTLFDSSKDIDVRSLEPLRKATEQVGPGTEQVIRKSIARCFPAYKAYAHVISGDEIRSKKIPPIAELKQRDAYYIFTANHLHVGVTRESIEREYGILIKDAPEIQKPGEIKGTCAFPGLVRGVARIVMGFQEVNKVQEGDIIVASMTMLDVAPAVKKAAAIVTDEGGILCHAAIVAREMKKPCIIGTKIATKVLHDGDIVEVDAYIGVVKKVK
ncbi:hypothetical protein HY491_03570 [Candidatus Woesearchaeota archaeon]|nr:hypothetical protein [Candidatus Woesearchaeota archaeon]